MKLTVASSPHIRGDFRTSRLMMDVVTALIPGLIVGIIVHGFHALIVVALSMISAVLTEWFWAKLHKQPHTIRDCSALVTGMLFAMTLSPSVPLYVPILGSAFAIAFVKCMCGGLGQNIFNPALTARALMMLLFPAALTVYPSMAADGISSATPLHHMVMPALPEQSLMDMLLGNCPGSIGEISAFALLAGGAWLILRKVISVRIPAAYLSTVALLTLLFPRTGTPFVWMFYQLFSGGVILGAIYMATDYATSPVTAGGQILYGIGCGALTVLFRYYGIFPEGVTYAILIMNAFVWTIDRYTAPRRFGLKKGGTANG